MDLSNFSKEFLPILAIMIIVVGFIFSYILSFIGKIIRFLVLALAGILFILYYSGYDLNSKSIQNFIQNIKLQVIKLVDKYLKDLNLLQNSSLNLEGAEKLKDSNLTLFDIKEIKKTLMEVLNKTDEKR